MSRFSWLLRLTFCQCRDWDSQLRHDQDKLRPPSIETDLQTFLYDNDPCKMCQNYGALFYKITVCTNESILKEKNIEIIK